MRSIRVAARLLFGEEVRLSRVCPAAEESHVVSGAQHHIPHQQVSLGDLVTDLRKRRSYITRVQSPAVGHVSAAVAAEAIAAVWTVPAALIGAVALTVWDLLIHPTLGTEVDPVSGSGSRSGWGWGWGRGIAAPCGEEAVVAARTLIMFDVDACTATASVLVRGTRAVAGTRCAIVITATLPKGAHTGVGARTKACVGNGAASIRELG